MMKSVQHVNRVQKVSSNQVSAGFTVIPLVDYILKPGFLLQGGVEGREGKGDPS